jgi:quercetin dioxygenase-like cupin family protein
MSKSTTTYWNPLLSKNKLHWKPVAGMHDVAEEITLAVDEESGDYTRLTRFEPGADTSSIGPKSHDYPEEIMIIQGRLYDEAFDTWLEVGDYASRPPGEVHGPFKTDAGCVVLEMSFPSQVVGNNIEG